MGRGYVVGLLVGALFSSVSVGALSLMLPPLAPITPPDLPEPQAPAASADMPPAEAPEETPTPEAAADAPEAVVPPVADATEAPAGDSPDATAPDGGAPAPAVAMPEPASPTAPAAAPENPPTPAAQDTATAPEAPAGAAPDTVAAATPRPETPVVEVPAGSEFNRPKPEEEPLVPAPQPAPAAASAPSVSMPAEEAQPELTERTPAAIPEGQAAAPAALAEPPAPAALPVAEAPAAESSVPVPPPGEAAAPGLAPAPEAEGLAPGDAVPAPPTEPAPAPAAQAEAKPEPKILVPLPPKLPGATGAAGPVILPPPDDTAEGQIVPAPGEAPTAEAGAAENAPRILTPGAGRSGGQGPVIIDIAPQPPIGAANGPKVGFSQKSGVRVNRLPSIGAAEPAPETAPETAEAENAPAEEAPAALSYAAAFDNPGQKPVIAVILVDDGAQGGAEPDSVAEIGAPVTIGIDPERPGAQALARTYRLSGEEVAILAPAMPDGATPSDVEVSYQGFVQALPESVALIAAPDSAVQGDRRAAQHMAALLAPEGRALVTYARGLNPARQAAERAGVPYAGIVRSLDEAGQDDAAMQRLLDRAAFDAARGGSQVVIGHATPATVAALKDWITAGGNEAVIGPLSAVLKP